VPRVFTEPVGQDGARSARSDDGVVVLLHVSSLGPYGATGRLRPRSGCYPEGPGSVECLASSRHDPCRGVRFGLCVDWDRKRRRPVGNEEEVLPREGLGVTSAAD
jgi:hypothetical protein